MIAFLIFIVILGILFAALIGIYNSLVKLRNMSEQSWSDIDVQLKRRYDLIPNLVETVKGYASHEKETFEKVVQARNAAMQASSPNDKSHAENILQSTLR
ncbi:MAG: LemA family protein, partial [Thermodesulfobacteriota bacterium]